jgi:hypothetical protein
VKSWRRICGFEELDANGQICLAEPFLFDDPPGDLAA